MEVCDSYFWAFSGITFINDTIIKDTLFGANSIGCDSIGHLNLKVKKSTNSSITLSACNQFTSPSGKLILVNGTYLDTISNSTGCDSIITLNLTVNTSSQYTDSVTSCISYTWINNGQTYYRDTIVSSTIIGGSSKGCDSINTMKITIKSIDTSVSLIYPYLKAEQDSASYQWLDCNNSFAPISSGTSQWFTIPANGSYAIEITKDGCVDTSGCITLNNVSIDDNSLSNKIKVYPNPSSDKVTIELESLNEVAISVYDASGKLIETFTDIRSHLYILDLSYYTEGIYILKLNYESEYRTVRIVKIK